MEEKVLKKILEALKAMEESILKKIVEALKEREVKIEARIEVSKTRSDKRYNKSKGRKNRSIKKIIKAMEEIILKDIVVELLSRAERIEAIKEIEVRIEVRIEERIEVSKNRSKNKRIIIKEIEVKLIKK